MIMAEIKIGFRHLRKFWLNYFLGVSTCSTFYSYIENDIVELSLTVLNSPVWCCMHLWVLVLTVSLECAEPCVPLSHDYPSCSLPPSHLWWLKHQNGPPSSFSLKLLFNGFGRLHQCLASLSLLLAVACSVWRVFDEDVTENCFLISLLLVTAPLKDN